MIQSTPVNTLRVAAKPNNREQSPNDTSRSRSALPVKSMPNRTGLMPLVQGLTEQLNQDKPQSKASKPAQDLIYQPRNTITGTDGDDKLQGGRDHDRIEGLAGDDRLYGRQGNDVLNGGEGEDRLYGGRGNDFLNGGSGNDYLSGGRGNNHLNGGAGDDTLASRLGNDVLNGGQGNDTARIRGNLDDYTITPRKPSPFPVPLPLQGDIGIDSIFPQPLPFPLPIPVPVDSVLLTNKKTGQTISVSNIEKFRFNDVRLSFDELIKHGEGNNETKLDLSKEQHAAIAKRFNRTPPPNTADGLTTRYTGMTIDKDGDNKLSVGDVVKLRDTGGIAGIDRIRDHVLTVDDVKDLNAPQEGKELPLSREQQNRTLDLFRLGIRVGGEHVKILDSDGDGKVSKGDVAVHLITELAPTQELGRLTLTEAQAAKINGIANSDRELKLTDIQHKAIANHFNSDFTGVGGEPIPHIRYLNSATDKNGDGKLSVGDTVKLHERVSPSGFEHEIDHVLTAKDIIAINSSLPNPEPELKLTDKQHQAIAQHLDINFSRSFERHYLNSATDKDGNGRLSAGDTVKLLERQLTPVESERIVDYVLTPRDIAVITGRIDIPIDPVPPIYRR